MLLAESSNGSIDGARVPSENFFTCRSKINEQISRPAIETDLYQICPALVRGIMELGLADCPNQQELLERSNMVDVILRVKGMLQDRDLITSAKTDQPLLNITKLCQQNIKFTQRRVSIPDTIRNAAKSLLGENVKGKRLDLGKKWCIERLHTEMDKRVEISLQKTPEWLEEVSSWVNSTFIELKRQLSTLIKKDCFVFLTKQPKNEEGWEHLFLSLKESILSAKNNTFLSDPRDEDRMSRDAYLHCRVPFGKRDTFKPFEGIVAKLRQGLPCVIEQHAASLLCASDGSTPEISEAAVEKICRDVMQQKWNLKWNSISRSCETFLFLNMRPRQPRKGMDVKRFKNSGTAIKSVLQTLFHKLLADFPDALLEPPTSKKRLSTGKKLYNELQRRFSNDMVDENEKVVKEAITKAVLQLRGNLEVYFKSHDQHQSHSSTLKATIKSLRDQENVVRDGEVNMEPEFLESIKEFGSAFKTLKKTERAHAFS